MGVYINGFYAFSPVSDDDRAGMLYVATILSLLFSIITLIVRFHVQRRTFGLDFWLIVAATVVALGQCASIFTGLGRYGLGKAIDLVSESDRLNAGRCAMASVCLFIISNALSKYSVIFFMKRLFSSDNQTARLLCNTLLGLVAIWTVASMLGLNIGCGASTKLDPRGRCGGQIIRWSIVSTFDSLFELAICILSVILVMPLQMTHEIKLSVIFAFSFRIIVAVFAVIHVYYVSRWSSALDPSLAAVYSLLWQQVELGYALVSATIPTLRSFIRGYEKAMGWESSYSVRNTNTHQSSSAYPLGSMLSKSRHEEEEEGRGVLGLERESTYDRQHPLRPDGPNYKAKIYGPAFGNVDVHHHHHVKRSKSNSSGGSDVPIIRKHVEIQVSSESAQ